MLSFVALYRGRDLPSAELVAVSTDPGLVADVASALLSRTPRGRPADPALGALNTGRRRALRVVAREGARSGA
jgi:hypothetical protein